MKMQKMSDDELKEMQKLGKKNPTVNHLYWCYLTMFENACDPNANTLVFKPEIQAAIDSFRSIKT